MNHELDRLIQGVDIVRLVKSRRIQWLDHVRQMDDRRSGKRIAHWRPVGRIIEADPERDG